MPLGIFSVRNEYEMGGKELYKNTVENEDPKAILDGVSVAGLVGILRQLGDLSLFAAEIFHGLQEQVASTASRNCRLVTRVQRAEASLPSPEKAILSQTSHIHFAYAPGSELHPRIETEQNQFILKDLPHFIMDLYEECSDPPRLQFLDRFDTSGPGSCLKRYTDPTFFRQASPSSKACNRDRSQREKRSHKIKSKRSLLHSRPRPGSLPDINRSWREPVSSHTGREGSSLSQPGSTFDDTFRSDALHKSNSRNLKLDTSFVESLSHPSISDIDENNVETGKNKHLNDHQKAMISEDVQVGLLINTNVHSSSDITWDEELEIMAHLGPSYRTKEYVKLSSETNNLFEQNVTLVDEENFQGHDLSEHPSSGESSALNDDHEQNGRSLSQNHPVEVAKVQELDSVNIKLRGQDLVQLNSKRFPRLPSVSVGGDHNLVKANPDSMRLISKGSFVLDHLDGKLITVGDILETSDDNNSKVEAISRNLVGVSIPRVETVNRNHVGVSESVKNISVTEWRQSEDVDSDIDNFVDALNTIDSDSESDFETYTKK